MQTPQPPPSCDPNGAWMEQVARNLTDAQAGFLRGSRYLIHDRDLLFTARFQAIRPVDAAPPGMAGLAPVRRG